MQHRLAQDLSDMIDRGENLLGDNTPAAVTGPAACAAMTATLVGVDTATDMTAAQAATIVADFAALKTAADANNAAIDSIIAALQAAKIMQS